MRRLSKDKAGQVRREPDRQGPGGPPEEVQTAEKANGELVRSLKVCVSETSFYLYVKKAWQKDD